MVEFQHQKRLKEKLSSKRDLFNKPSKITPVGDLHHPFDHMTHIYPGQREGWVSWVQWESRLYLLNTINKHFIWAINVTGKCRTAGLSQSKPAQTVNFTLTPWAPPPSLFLGQGSHRNKLQKSPATTLPPNVPFRVIPRSTEYVTRLLFLCPSVCPSTHPPHSCWWRY